MMFIVTPLLLAGLVLLFSEARNRWWGIALIAGLTIGSLLAAYGIVHMVYGERSSAVARRIFAKPYLPSIVAPLVTLAIAGAARWCVSWRAARGA